MWQSDKQADISWQCSNVLNYLAGSAVESVMGNRRTSVSNNSSRRRVDVWLMAR